LLQFHLRGREAGSRVAVAGQNLVKGDSRH